MEKTITITSGNPIVDQVATMNLTGNIIPESWYHTIINENGKTNTLAILILADIVYWYRPTEERDETTLSVSYSKKFHDEDYLQRSYEQLMEKFNISKRQARDALILLETLGVVKRHFRNIVVAGLPLSNVMYLELVPDVLKELTFPSGQNFDLGNNKFVTTSSHKRNEDLSKTEQPLSKNDVTYTKTTSETSSKITTESSSTTIGADFSTDAKNSAAIVDDAREVFKEFGLSDKDIQSILSASGYDIERCKKAKTVLNQQSTKINNVAGWLIKAVRENYQPLAKSPSRRNSIHNFDERNYTDADWAEIERRLLAKSYDSF